MPNKFSEIPVKSSLTDFERMCPFNEYRILTSGSYPPDLPTDLTRKFNHAYCIASASVSSVVYVITGERVDGNEIDEHPFIVAFNRETGTGYGGIIHHGNWDGRTTEISAEMAAHISSSGIEKYYPLQKLPTASGSLSAALASPLSSSFWASVTTLKKHDPDPKY